MRPHMAIETSFVCEDWSGANTRHVSSRALVRRHSGLSKKRQLLCLCARIGFNPPVHRAGI